MSIVCDLHVHSRYAYATSKNIDLQSNALWGRWKGIDVLGTGDILHGQWLAEVKNQLVEGTDSVGLYKLKDEFIMGSQSSNKLRFMLTTETSHIYSQNGVSYRIHLVTLFPDIETVDIVRAKLQDFGVRLEFDGRPITKMSVPKYCDLVFSTNEDCMIIPAHIWTPWYGLYGSKSGFDRFNDCFKEFSPFIYAVETGLSTDPSMNWSVGDLDERAIVSFSDAHSSSKLGREATVVNSELSYKGITDAIQSGSKFADGSSGEIAYTIEYYPEEGKYHYDGHRKCHTSHEPKNTTLCYECGKPLTLGVLHRIKDLANWVHVHGAGYMDDEYGVRWFLNDTHNRPTFVKLIPLHEILAEVCGVGINTKTVQSNYLHIINSFGSEFEFLLHTDLNEISELLGPKVSEAIRRVRSGKLTIIPGYDGVFGRVSIFTEDNNLSKSIKQVQLFQ